MISNRLRAAVVQLSCQADLQQNLARVRALVAEAAGLGARLVALPENFAFMGEETDKQAIAEALDERGPIVSTLSELARAHGVHLVAGGMPERSDDPARPYNTSLLVAPSGAIAARYRKIHLFDVDLPDGTSLKESAGSSPGDEPCTADVGDVGLGMTICYDLRFPELYRALATKNVRVVTVPAAFTLTTGKDHWHVLLRARDREPGLRPRARAARQAPARAHDLRKEPHRRPVG